MSKGWPGQGQKGIHRSGDGVWGKVIPNPKLKLLDQVREVMRLKHYSIRTERCYCDWIRRYIHFHKMQLREELTQDAKAKMELFLSDLAVRGQVAAATQNQAFNALLFLYREVLHQPLDDIQAVRADRPVRVPVVLSQGEVRGLLQQLSGTQHLIGQALYGTGLRLLECLRLRVHPVR
jgi:site-specific recombinase XerD